MRRFILLSVALMLFMPAASSEAPSSGGKYMLGIYGNANMDETIDEMDIAYVEGVIKGINNITDFSDANYDGDVDQEDIEQINKIISGMEENLTIVDSYKRIVTVSLPPKRIVSISIYNNDALRMLGMMDRVVAIEDSTKKKTVFFPQGSDLPSIGGYPPNPEAIYKYEPDLLLGATSWTKELCDKLPASVTIVGLDFTSKTQYSFAEETMKLGYILNSREKARDYIDNFQGKYLGDMEDKTEGLAEDERPKVYVESSFGKYKAYGGNGSGAQTYLELAGGRNIFEDSPLYFEADPEAVIVKNPDIIIKQLRNDVGYPADNLSVMKSARDEILNRLELANVSAIINKDVYIIDEGISYGFSYPVAVAYMAGWLHPGLFRDMDPQAMHQEFIDKYCPGLNFDVRKHGSFAYPPEAAAGSL